jgi:Icc-related predicted phosphoesterase
MGADILAEARRSAERLQHIVDAARPELILHGHLHRSDRVTVDGTTVVSLAQERHPGNAVAVDLATLDVAPIPL